MVHLNGTSPEDLPALLRRELGLVREAISMVASGVAPRVVVAGLQMGGEVVHAARRFGLQADVRIVPLWVADHAGVDIAVERRDRPTQ